MVPKTATFRSASFQVIVKPVAALPAPGPAILGFDRRGDTLTIRPCVPDAWDEYAIEYRFGRSVYAITVHDPARVRHRGAEVRMDGRVLEGAEIPLVDDAARHGVSVRPRSVRPVAA